MNYELGRQLATRRDNRLAGREPVRIFRFADLLTGLQDGRTPGMVDGAVDASAAHQAGIGGIHDGVHLLLGDVTLKQNDRGVTYLESILQPLKP
jgi:hypothetical protein